MGTNDRSGRLQLIAIESETDDSEFAAQIRRGLTSPQKFLPCRYFYDDAGSKIFEKICELPEYYLTRSEHEILRSRSFEIADMFNDRTTIVELGSGNSKKTRTIIEAFLARHGRLRYVPLDISRDMLEQSAHDLLQDYPKLEIVAIAAEYRHGLRKLSDERKAQKLVLWLGSSAGNFTREEAARFLASVRAELSADDRMLLGLDLRKDSRVIERAYNDVAGVTAEFNENILLRINRELDANFDVALFRHCARFDSDLGRIEMHLVSERAQEVHLKGLDLRVEFAAGESIHTENSYKYSTDEISDLAKSAGMHVEESWFDSNHNFSVSLLAPTTPPS